MLEILLLQLFSKHYTLYRTTVIELLGIDSPNEFHLKIKPFLDFLLILFFHLPKGMAKPIYDKRKEIVDT